MSQNIGWRADVKARLRASGYKLTDFEPKLGKDSKRPAAIAYAANADGDLVPWLAVEVRDSSKPPAAALPSLLASRDLLGTSDHYAVINGEWYRADRSLRSFQRVDGPVAPPHGECGIVQDVSLATALVADRLWYEADRARGTESRSDLPQLPDIFAETSTPGIEMPSGEFVAVQADVLWQARRQAISLFASRTSLDHPTPPPAITNAIALLTGNRLGGRVLDPFWGTGGLLWAAIDRAIQLGLYPKFHGQDINARIVGLAEAIARVAPLQTTVRAGDSLCTELPQANIVVSAPPFGMRLNEPYELLDGMETRDGDAAAIDRCLRHLPPGGRAVLLASSAITFRVALERYRRFVASEFRVGAVIALPGGCLSNTGIRTVILVIDRDSAGETFVAQLGEDWQTQLSPGGAALNAAQQHLDGFIDGE